MRCLRLRPKHARSLGELDTEQHLGFADHLAEKGKIAEAAVLYRALFLLTRNRDFCRRLVSFLSEQGRPIEALRFLREIQNAYPAQYWIYVLLADFFVGVRKIKAAEGALRAGLKNLPEEPRLLSRLARLLANERKWNVGDKHLAGSSLRQ